MWGMVNDPKRVHKVVARCRQDGCQFLHGSVDEANIRELVNRCALPGYFEGSLREIDRRDFGARPGKIYRVGTDPATHFKDTFAGPSGECSEPRDVGLDKVFSGFHFIEILPLADRPCGMPDVARTGVPEGPHLRNWDISEVAHLAPARRESALTLSEHGLQLATHFVGISVLHMPINRFNDAL